MDDDRTEGKLKQGEGEVQETWGDVKEKVGRRDAMRPRDGQAGEGELQETLGEVKEKADGLWEKAKDAVDGDDDKPNR